MKPIIPYEAVGETKLINGHKVPSFLSQLADVMNRCTKITWKDSPASVVAMGLVTLQGVNACGR